MTFAACLPIILESEGGFVNDPADPGGATNLGITIGTLSAWEGHAATIGEVAALTPATVAPIYEAQYYRASGASHCPDGLDLMVFDCAVNQGVGRALKFLQASLGVAIDGQFGPMTLSAVQKCDPVKTINAMSKAREAHYLSLPTFAHFGKGWLARLKKTTTLALGMVHA